MTQTAVTVRESTPGDRAHIVGFQQQMALETEGKTLDRELLERGVASVFQCSEKGFYVVAESDGQIVGSLLITYEWSDWRNANFWWIQSVYVEPEFRKRGVYTALYRHVEDEARASGDVCGIRLYVDEENKRAQTVYHQLGMHRSRYFMYESEEITPGFRNDAEG